MNKTPKVNTRHTYPERPDRVIVNPGHLATIDDHAAYVQDDATDQIEMAQGELATAKTCIRLHGAVGDWKEPVEAAITILETLLDLTGGKETAGKDEE